MLPLKHALLAILAITIFDGRALARPAGERSLDQLFEFVLEERLGTVVAASRREQGLMRAPAAVTVLKSDQLRQMVARHVVDLLRAVPGLQVVEVAPGNYSLSLRGMGGLQSNNLIVMVDGLILNNPADGNVPWANLPLHVDDIEQIEVVRGPVSTIYGADAFTGVVLFRTYSGKGGKGVRAGARAGSGVSTRGKLAGQLHGWVAGSSQRLDWRVSAAGNYDQTFTDSERASQPALARGSFLGRIGWGPSPHLSVDAALTASWSRASATDGLVLEALPHDTFLAGATLDISLLDLGSWLPSLTLWGRAHTLRRDADAQEYLGFNYDGMRTLSGRGGLSSNLRLPLGIDLELGVESAVIDLQAAYVHPQEKVARWTHAARMRAEVDIAERLTIEAGVRGDISSFTPEIEGSARGSLIYHQKGLSLRLTGGSAYRNPTFVEAGSRFIDPTSGLVQIEGNGSLQPPRLTAVEMGAIVGLWRNRIVLRPTAYFTHATNLVVIDFESVVRRTFINDFRDINILGGELEFSWQIRPELIVEGFVAGMYFLSEQENPSATVGNANHNSLFSFRLAARGSLVGDRLTLGGATTFTSSRLWDARAGVPPVLFPQRTSPAAVRLEASATWALHRSIPLFARLQLLGHLPFSDVIESAFINGARQGTMAMLSLRYGRP